MAGRGPGVVFLGGFKSDMEGTKAVHLEAWAARTGRAFLRFDYSGHGQSSEVVHRWRNRRLGGGCGVCDHGTDRGAAGSGRVVHGRLDFVADGTSAHPEKVAGMVTIAAAPDFTEDSMWAGFDAAQRTELMAQGQIALPSDYGEPYIITKRLIEEGRTSLVLRDPLPLPFPVRFLQGTADADVDMSVALRLLDHAEGPDMRLTLVDGADHRFSDPDCRRPHRDGGGRGAVAGRRHLIATDCRPSERLADTNG